MKRLLLTLICCSPLVLSPASCFALDSTLAVSAEIPSYQKYGPIRYYESLWSVSKKLRPNRSVSVQQTLVAIYKLNPAVFVAGDINHLIENSVINVPTYQFIKQQTNQEAIILINKYSNLNSTQTTNIKRVNENIAEPLSGTEAKNPATDAVAVMTTVTQELAAGNAPSTEILNSASNDDKNYLVNSQLRTATSLENPGNVSLIKAATSLAGDAQQTDQVNAALPAAEMQSGSEENNPDNGSLPADSAAAESDTVSPIQLQALKNELNSVNAQLVATIAINEDLKSGLHLLIDEIDLLKNQMDSESAAQANLFGLMEQYGIELNSSQPSVFDIGNSSTQRLSWVTASLTNLLIVIGSPLLLAILVFSLLLRHNTRKLQAENNKQINTIYALPVAAGRETKELPRTDSINNVQYNIPETDNELPTSSLEDTPRSENTADEFDNIGSPSVVVEAVHIAPAKQDSKQSEPETVDLIFEATATEQLEDEVKVDKQLTTDTGDLSEQNTIIEIADQDKEADAQAQLMEFEEQAAEINNKPAKSNNTIKLKNSENYIDIETLLQNSEGDSPDELYTDLNLDLGLDEFPDMLSAHDAIDIDDDEYGISAKLDLARAYLEIDDKRSARAILIASLENSDAEQRNEIDKLLIRL